ncbi:peptidase M23 [Vibrio panuliri]|uniref:Peptidase M23 n=1 Tax=Vibrio panuliri TaxID=1381081 RepID=A0A1Q9HQF4_9VIBR|nr:peptidoglycan DD-metalloendopeptidase family protein [Vibrio panuliri]OLQ93075.1 peptidase M23 [Vibrio panuliri]
MLRIRFILAAIAISAFSVAALISEPPDEAAKPQPIKITPYESLIDAVDVARIEPVHSEPIKVHYFVKVGDTLSGIFSDWNLPYTDLLKILSADHATLQLDTIKPGDYLEFTLDSHTRQLISLSYHISLVEKAIYRKNPQGEFSYQFEETPSQWRERLYSGVVNGSFSLSAHKLGLSSNQIGNITRVLKDKLDFSRALRAGDSFNVLVKEQFLDDHPTGNNEIQAISFKLAKGEVAAFLASDGRFYDRHGNSLERAFNRYPIDTRYRRITSPFNPKRKHPVTGRISPHNGTDFATPVGAPIYSIGDGKVIGVRNHPYAGKYLVIEHNSVYTTRYLHLSKFLVKKGQYVQRGQKIALSGATGRLTGPHLHFEVLVRNRAVDPMKADLPLASFVSANDKAAFLAKVKAFDAMLVEKQSG